MASVDVTELIPSLEAILTIPGQDSPYAAASEEEWTLKLVNSFWRTVLDGIVEGYSIDEDGIITPDTGDSTFSRLEQQIVVIYAAMNVIQAQLLQLKTVFKAKAGSVEYETQQASQVLTALLSQLEKDKGILLERLSDLGEGTDAYYYDAPWERRDNQRSLTSGYWAGY